MIYIGDIQYDTDISVSQNRTAADSGILDIKIVQIGRERLYNNLLFSQKLIYEQAVGLVAGIHPHKKSVFQAGDGVVDIIQLVKTYKRVKITHAAYHLMAFGIIDDILRKSLEGLADIGDRHGENSAADADLHAVHNGQGKRNAQCHAGPLSVFTGYGYGAAYAFHIPFYNIHTHAASGVFRYLLIGGEAGKHQEREDFLLAVFFFRFCKNAVFTGLCQNSGGIDSLSVIFYYNDNLAAGMAGG